MGVVFVGIFSTHDNITTELSLCEPTVIDGELFGTEVVSQCN